LSNSFFALLLILAIFIAVSVLLLLQGELLHEMVGLLVHVLRQLLDLLKQNRLPPLQLSFLTG
jgi:hypothetical protein